MARGFFETSFGRRHFLRPPTHAIKRSKHACTVLRDIPDDDTPLRADTQVQNCSGVLAPGQPSVVRAGMEDSTIAVQMTFGLCFSRFEASHEPERLALSAEELTHAVAELNRTLRWPPAWACLLAPCCFGPCLWRDAALKRKTAALSRRFAARGVRFAFETRLCQGMQAENEQNHYRTYYLVVEQHPQPLSEAGAASHDCGNGGPEGSSSSSRGSGHV